MNGSGPGPAILSHNAVASSDDDLIARSRTGDRDAWGVLVRRHAPRLGAYLGARLRRPTVVEKLVEDAIVLAYRHLDELEPGESFPPWFRRIGAHLALRWYREHQDEGLSEPFPAHDDAVLHQALQRLEDILGGLSDSQRMALEQRYRGGIEGEDLAEVLHVDVSKAERMIEEALVALERNWQKA